MVPCANTASGTRLAPPTSSCARRRNRSGKSNARGDSSRRNLQPSRPKWIESCRRKPPAWARWEMIAGTTSSVIGSSFTVDSLATCPASRTLACCSLSSFLASTTSLPRGELQNCSVTLPPALPHQRASTHTLASFPATALAISIDPDSSFFWPRLADAVLEFAGLEPGSVRLNISGKVRQGYALSICGQCAYLGIVVILLLHMDLPAKYFR